VTASASGVDYRLAGDGRLTVLITQGLGSASAEWWPIQDALANRARVLTWDRPGYGESGPHRSARTLANVAREALELLQAVAPDGPLILVGHSQGGLYTNALSRLVRSRVRGVALLDPVHPDNGRLRRELPPRVFRNSGSDLAVRLRAGNTMARLHLMGLLKPVIMGAPPFTFCRRHPPAARRAMWRHLKRAQAYQAALAEYEELEFRTVAGDLDDLGPFPEVPLRVLVHDPEVLTTDMSARLPREQAAQVEAMWGELLREQASLNPLGRLQTAGGSGHLIHLEKPELVLAAISELVKGSAGGQAGGGSRPLRQTRRQVRGQRKR
jgi:pimeloyl-ACP methyl ester carboxylesterase